MDQSFYSFDQNIPPIKFMTYILMIQVFWVVMLIPRALKGFTGYLRWSSGPRRMPPATHFQNRFGIV
jgi:hypothetical protein